SSLDFDSQWPEEAIAELFSITQTVQILCLTRQSVYGSNFVNSYLSTQLRAVYDPNSYGPVYHGMPIIIQQNDHRLSLYNGDTGIILKDKRHHYWAVFQRNDRFIRFPVETLAPYELAFAITVHKSQGSEYQSTLLILPDTDNRLLSREILYTAVTRAKTELLIYGSIETLQIGIDKKLHRESGIELWSNA
ncbi:MAG: ATP-binding domain-containing protein, partial [Lentisphaeria bacterium]|nr:ATP-binding domain-containing protein [Lentisphaeria bacterium]